MTPCVGCDCRCTANAEAVKKPIKEKKDSVAGATAVGIKTEDIFSLSNQSLTPSGLQTGAITNQKIVMESIKEKHESLAEDGKSRYTLMDPQETLRNSYIATETEDNFPFYMEHTSDSARPIARHRFSRTVFA